MDQQNFARIRLDSPMGTGQKIYYEEASMDEEKKKTI